MAQRGLVPGQRRDRREGRRADPDLPAHARPADAGRALGAGAHRDPRRHGARPAPRRLDRPHDPRDRRRDERGRVPARPDRARHRRRARPAAGELPQGAQGLPQAGRGGLRRRPRPDDLRQLREHPRPGERDRCRVHRLDRLGSVRRRVLLHGRQRRHPHRVRDGRAVVQAERLREGRVLLGAGLVGHRLPRLVPQRSAQPRSRDRRHGSAVTEPRRHAGEPGQDARPRRGSDRLHGLRLLHVPLQARVRRARLGPAALHGHRVHVLFEHQRVGRRSRRLARGRPAGRRRDEPELQRDDGALRAALRSQVGQRRRRVGVRHRAAPRSTASRTRRSPSRRK